MAESWRRRMCRVVCRGWGRTWYGSEVPPRTRPDPEGSLSLVAVATHRDLAALDRRRAQSADDVVGDLVRELDEGEAVGDLDGTDDARIDPCLVDDRPDQVAGPHLRVAAGADVHAHDVSVEPGGLATRPSRLRPALRRKFGLPAVTLGA